MTPLERAFEVWDQRALEVGGYPRPTMFVKLGLELEPESSALEDEMQRTAAQLGMSSTALRIRIVNFRRSGHDGAAAVRMAIASGGD